MPEMPERLRVTEGERTLIGARDRFRRITQGALSRFQERILDEAHDADLSQLSRALDAACWSAADEYRKAKKNLKE